MMPEAIVAEAILRVRGRLGRKEQDRLHHLARSHQGSLVAHAGGYTPPTVLELFSGCGGAALGLSRAGFGHLACVEWDEAAAKTLKVAGFPALHKDVRDVAFSVYKGVDLLWASPPCQAGSTAGSRKGASDARNGWPWTLEAIDAVRPTWVLAENVLGWTYHREGCDRKGRDLSCVGCYWQNFILPAFKERYPHTGVWRCNGADYGVPQHRRRVILWAGPDALPDPPPTHLDPEDGELPMDVRPWRTLRESVGQTFQRESCTEEGGFRRCYPCDGSHGQACAEPWRLDRPAPTVTTKEVKGTRAHSPEWHFNGGPDRASDAAFLIFGGRRITEQEAAILQGFPEDWPFQGTSDQIYRQIGNAVPPALAEAAGRVVIERLLATVTKGRQDAIELSQNKR